MMGEDACHFGDIHAVVCIFVSDRNSPRCGGSIAAYRRERHHACLYTASAICLFCLNSLLQELVEKQR